MAPKWINIWIIPLNKHPIISYPYHLTTLQDWAVFWAAAWDWGFYSFILLIYSVCVRTYVSVWANTTCATSTNLPAVAATPEGSFPRCWAHFLGNLPSHTHSTGPINLCAGGFGLQPRQLPELNSHLHKHSLDVIYVLILMWGVFIRNSHKCELSQLEKAWKVWAIYLYFSCQQV